MKPRLNTHPWIDVYSQRKAVTPAATPTFASGIFCSSTRAAIDLMVSDEQDLGDEATQPPNSGSASFILPIGHENSKAISSSWRFSVSSLSTKEKDPMQKEI